MRYGKPDPICDVRHNEDQNGLRDIVGVCTWMTSFMGLPINAKHMAEMVSIGWGAPVTAEALFEAVARTRPLQRAYEIREGMTRTHDALPKRFYQQIKPEVASASRVALSPEELGGAGAGSPGGAKELDRKPMG